MKLDVSVTHPDRENDSQHWQHAYLEIEDMNHPSHPDYDGSMDAAAQAEFDKHNGYGFDAFSYGVTRAAKKDVNDNAAYHDATGSTAGISRVNAYTWRSYATDCHRWIHEDQSGVVSEQGGTSSLKLKEALEDGSVDYAPSKDPEHCSRLHAATGLPFGEVTMAFTFAPRESRQRTTSSR